MIKKLPFIPFSIFLLVVSFLKGYSQTEQDFQIDSLSSIIKEQPSTLKAAEAYVVLSEILYLSDADTILPLCLKALTIIDENGKTDENRNEDFANKIKAQALNNIGYVYYNYGNSAKGLEYYLRGLKIRQRLADSKGIAESLNNIGHVYKSLNNFSKALDYYNSSIDIRYKSDDKKGIAKVLNNIAVLYSDKGDISGALPYYKQSLQIYSELSDNYGIANSQYNLGIIYYNQGEYNLALQYYHDSQKRMLGINDPKFSANILLAMSEVYLQLKNITRAKGLAIEAHTISKELGFPALIMRSAHQLYLLNTMQKKWQEALYMKELHSEMKDSIFNEEQTANQVRAEMNDEFESKFAADKIKQEKKEATLAFESKKQKAITLGVSVILFLVAGFALYVFRSFRQKQKANLELSSKNLIIEEQKSIVEEKSIKLNELFTEVRDSINYAKRIQASLLPPMEEVIESIPEVFILFKPKDIVSGDFYWLTNKFGKTFIAAADCTGHGVPGAFMSMLNADKLNAAVENTSDVSEILKLVNVGLKKVLRQSEDETSTRDGMDIALCSLTKTNQGLGVEYAGANRPLWIIRKNAKTIEEIKGTKAAIGGLTPNAQAFNKHYVELNKGDTIYLFSDGYPDQFSMGGKKLMIKKLKECLLNIQNLGMIDQHSFLEHFIEDWKAGADQTDDILVIGVRA